ncbi:hypothetical protein KP509_27G027900 [Ceratopteris richardii]|uniref:RING-type E3 ubiquitin transferase n=1 Tax=Ceratopteris richardii TaxID=49495 RepID=A0A8T2RGQ4_CERRI|nr:hypothetical protein KP509_27G027900 [Ceratopteris richardii]
MDSSEEELCAALTRVALAGDGVVLGLSMAFFAIRTWLRFYSQSRAVHQLEDIRVSRIADLRELISTMETKPLVIVRGKVNSKFSLDSQWRRKEDGLLITHNGASKAVIIQRTQTCLYNEWRGLLGFSSDLRGLLGWGSLKEQVTASIQKVPFVLTDSQGLSTGSFVHIDLSDSKHPLPLATVYHQLHPVQASPFTFLQAIFGRGYPVGILDEEKILPPGKEITAVGVLDTALDKQPVIKSSKQLPLFLTELTKEQFMVEIAAHTRVLLWTGIIFSTCAVGILGYAFIRNWKKYKEWRLDRERRREQDRLSADRVDEDVSDVPDGELCVICLLRRRRAAFLHCGHLVCCVHCAQRVEQDINARCPVCRQDVNGIIRIYDP